MVYTSSDVGEVRFKVLAGKWINHIHLSEGDVLTLEGVEEKEGASDNTVWMYTLSAPNGQKFTITDQELEQEDAFEEML